MRVANKEDLKNPVKLLTYKYTTFLEKSLTNFPQFARMFGYNLKPEYNFGLTTNYNLYFDRFQNPKNGYECVIVVYCEKEFKNELRLKLIEKGWINEPKKK